MRERIRPVRGPMMGGETHQSRSSPVVTWEFPKIGGALILGSFKGYHKGSFKGSIRVLKNGSFQK